MMGQRRVLGAEEVWQAYDLVETRLTAPLSERMLTLACVGPGVRVLDLATGRGEPAIPAAHRVGRADPFWELTFRRACSPWPAEGLLGRA